MFGLTIVKNNEPPVFLINIGNSNSLQYAAIFPTISNNFLLPNFFSTTLLRNVKPTQSICADKLQQIIRDNKMD